MDWDDSYRRLCIDLDGVLNTFDGWKGADYFHPVRPGALEFLSALKDLQYRVAIFTVRYGPWVEDWLKKNQLADLVEGVTNRKPPAEAYIDDRAICFQGDFQDTLKQIASFRPFWQR